MKWGEANKHATKTKDTVTDGSSLYGLFECKASKADGGPHRWKREILKCKGGGGCPECRLNKLKPLSENNALKSILNSYHSNIAERILVLVRNNYLPDKKKMIAIPQF